MIQRLDLDMSQRVGKKPVNTRVNTSIDRAGGQYWF
jgi:hypothetical protein